MHFETTINVSSFGVKRSKFKVTVGPTCFLALITRYLENTELSALMYFETGMNGLNASILEVKGRRKSRSQHDKGPRDECIQSSTPCDVVRRSFKTGKDGAEVTLAGKSFPRQWAYALQ